MFLEKSTVNTMRGILKGVEKFLSVSATKVEENVSLLQTDKFRQKYEKDRFSLIDEINKSCNLYFSYQSSLEDIIGELSDFVSLYAKYIAKIRTISKALTKNGFVKATLGLETLPFTGRDKSIAIPFLMTSGIKVNSTLKDENALEDEREKKIYNLEKKMAEYIKDDYSVDFEDMIPFLEIYKKYLETCLELGDIFEKNIVVTYKDFYLLTMGLFITYSNTGIWAEEDEIIPIYELFEDYTLSGLVSTVEAIKLACEWLIYEVNKESKKKTLEPEETVNPLSEFVDGNQIVKVCDMTEFNELLAQSNLDDETKEILAGKMSDAIEQSRVEKHKKDIADLEDSTFNDYEKKIYNLGRFYKECEKTVADIDALFELLLETEDEASKESLLDELTSEMNTLRRWLPLELGEEGASIVYYNYMVEDSKGTSVKIPAMLDSILKDKMICGAYVDKLLKELLEENTVGDRKVKVANLPCTVWMKGREWKILYTKIGETLVIIDVASNEEVYGVAERLSSDEDFKDFLEKVREYITSGGKPKATEFTDLIKTTLNRPSKIMSLFGRDIHY